MFFSVTLTEHWKNAVQVFPARFFRYFKEKGVKRASSSSRNKNGRIVLTEYEQNYKLGKEK